MTAPDASCPDAAPTARALRRAAGTCLGIHLAALVVGPRGAHLWRELVL